jgi:hypothetical protein
MPKRLDAERRVLHRAAKTRAAVNLTLAQSPQKLMLWMPEQ